MMKIMKNRYTCIWKNCRIICYSKKKINDKPKNNSYQEIRSRLNFFVIYHKLYVYEINAWIKRITLNGLQRWFNRCTRKPTCISPSPLREWMEPLAMKYSMDFVMLVVCLRESFIVTVKQRDFNQTMQENLTNITYCC